MATILVTGAAGFIGFHVTRRLLADGHSVVGFDNVNSYYDPKLKEARLRILGAHVAFRFVRGDVADRAALSDVMASAEGGVVHLAAQAGVRWSLDHPRDYLSSNLAGFLEVLEAARQHHIPHLVYASSSSVYGANTTLPFSVGQDVSHPVSLYAATKVANEAMAFTYSHLFDVPATGLRFFTVYGPWGRPDMAYFKFTEAILAGRPIEVYNNGQLQRDFTYIDDIVEGVVRVLRRPPERSVPTGTSASSRHRLYNIGNHSPVALSEFIATLEEVLGVPALRRFLPMQPGDVPATYADVSELEAAVGFTPATTLRDGLGRFADWYRAFYQR